MVSRRRPLILPLLAVPALIGCQPGTAPLPPLSPAALQAVASHPGPPREALARAVDQLFTDQGAGDTDALLVFNNGRLVAERYRPGFTAETRVPGWALSTCVTGALIGLLVADGRLRLDQGVPVAAWQRPGDPRGEITLRQLLQMRSGLRHDEEADLARMLYLEARDDVAVYAEAQPLEAEPGRRWAWSSAGAMVLSDLVARALTDSSNPDVRRRLVNDYLHTRLLDPLGMRATVAEFDPAGTVLGGAMIHASARDWGRLGEFLRQRGAVGGAQVVPTDWVKFMVTANPRNAGFGAMLWLNRVGPARGPGLFPAGMPSDAFACSGGHGEVVLVAPTQGLTLVRLGRSQSGQRPLLRQRLGGILTLFGAADSD
jgi:CubicO group peptidase (beta-lactamase class C family)